ncbi:hypothetical protein CALCODRAFT_139572 [Calocera cornea HHB12733]|uniref:Uncharacterized protein n=1 Tax=Calocera cornea HHB12733 TaxID=1353952 RepID=A0A165K3N9_9BASI|nr:hypothetical protein CALCODRAFT_139572 [Calocera cornea HHB12733]
MRQHRVWAITSPCGPVKRPSALSFSSPQRRHFVFPPFPARLHSLESSRVPNHLIIRRGPTELLTGADAPICRSRDRTCQRSGHV